MPWWGVCKKTGHPKRKSGEAPWPTTQRDGRGRKASPDRRDRVDRPAKPESRDCTVIPAGPAPKVRAANLVLTESPVRTASRALLVNVASKVRRERPACAARRDRKAPP